MADGHDITPEGGLGEVALRVLTPADAGAYLALRLEALAAEPTAFGMSPEEEGGIEAMSGRLAAADVTVVGAFAAGRLVATAGLRRESNAKERHKAFVFGVYVTPAARGEGVGRALMNFVLDVARSTTGLRRLRLAVNASSAPARSLYGSLGFEPVGHEAQRSV